MQILAFTDSSLGQLLYYCFFYIMSKSFLGTLLGTQLHVICYAQLGVSLFME